MCTCTWYKRCHHGQMNQAGKARDAHLHMVIVRVCTPEGDVWDEVAVPGTPARVTVALASLAERVAVYARSLPPDVVCAWSGQVLGPDGESAGTFEGRDTARALGVQLCAQEALIGRLVAGEAQESVSLTVPRRLLRAPTGGHHPRGARARR